MNNARHIGRRSQVLLLAAACGVTVLTGCGPSFRELRQEGQQEMAARNWGAARHLFVEAHGMVPEHAENLHDLGVCATVLARRQFELQNPPAAMREVDRAIEYYSRSIDAFPGYQPSIVGKNRAQELKGQFEEALRTAHWAAKYIGPAADQFLFLGAEYEERGDFDAALLRYRQAAAMEPNSHRAHKALGFLYYRVGEKALAIDALDRSLRIKPTQKDVADLLNELGAPVPAVDLGPDD